MIINIHGFGSNGANSKYQWLSENIKHHNIYSPSFNYLQESPQQILNHLCHKIQFLLKQEEKKWRTTICVHSLAIRDYIKKRKELEEKRGVVYVIGSSLGGFYARCLNLTFSNVTAILINPSLAPFLNLRLQHHVSENICHGYIKLLEKYYDFDEEGKENLHVILAKGDEVIDHENITKALIPQYEFNNTYTVEGTHQLKITDEVASILKNIIKPPRAMEEGSRRVLGAKDMRLP